MCAIVQRFLDEQKHAIKIYKQIHVTMQTTNNNYMQITNTYNNKIYWHYTEAH